MPNYYQALDFDGADDYVDCGNPAALQITDDISVVAWIECGNHGAGLVQDNFMGRADGANQHSWAMMSNDTNIQDVKVWVCDDGTYGGGGTTTYQTTDHPLTNGWHMVGFTFSSGVLKIYVDGVEDTNINKVLDDASSIFNGTAHTCVGGFTLSGNVWQGLLCCASIWKTGVLTGADFLALYNAGTPVDPRSITPSGAAVLAGAWIWNETLTFPDIPDNAGSSDGDMQNMTAGDIVDSPWISSYSCLWAPDGYTLIPDSAFYPGQYIREGEDDPTDGSDATIKGQVDLACNSNYAHKRMVKSYVRQDLQSYTDPTKVIVQAVVAPIHIMSWRIDHLLADQGFRIRYTAKTADANAVEVQWRLYDFLTHVDTMTEADSFAAVNYTERTVDFDATAFAAYIAAAGYGGPHVLELWIAEEDVGGEIHLKTVKAESVDDGGNELTSGKRSNGVYPQCWEAWARNSAYSVDQVNTLGDNVEAIRTDKTSTLLNFCDVLPELASPAFESQVAQEDWQTIVRVPIEYQPGVSTISFAIAGFYVSASDDFRIYTQEELDRFGEDGITERQFSGLAGAFDITTAADWVVATMPVRETVGEKGADIVTLEFKGTVARGIVLVALELVEVY